MVFGAVSAAAIAVTSCSDSKTYAELLSDENKYVNCYLADQRVSNEIPADSTFNFEVGENAPYYPLDEDHNVYMQVEELGTPGNFATDDQIIYFRFTRYALSSYDDGELPEGEGNEADMSYANCWFRYNNYTLESTYQWGSGIQLPLALVPIDSKINLVVKSQYGVYDEMSYVVPYLYRIRYYKLKT